MTIIESLRNLPRWLAPPSIAQPDRFQYRLAQTYSVSAINRWFVMASFPAFLIGSYVKTENFNDPQAMLQLASHLCIALGVSFFWHALFARIRGHKIDPGWVMHGWLFCLLVPLATSLPLVVLGVSFGVTVGALIFGGTGRYLVSPALLGVLFIQLSYPSLLTAATGTTTWLQLASGDPLLAPDWLTLFLIQSAGNTGSISTAACAFGFIILWLAGAASLRVVVGALLGTAAAASVLHGATQPVFESLGFYWHFTVGLFPFCLAFLATDPSAGASTRAGRWLYGFLFGFLVVALRVLNPEHPEATLPAALLAILFAPLIDQCCVRFVLHRRGRSKTHSA
jgi:Na+-transporting NADH:ubiquinone oxidoreductase subunit B